MNSSGPLISIVTPSFNQGKYIEETILSVLNQSYRNFELIIIDGGSTDETVDIIRRYEDRIAYWVSEKDNGQTHAILKGLQKCTGTVFNWINSDDRLAPGSLERIAQLYTANNSPDLVAGDIEMFDDAGMKKRHLRINFWNNIPKTLGFGQMCQPGMFYRTDVVKQVGLNTSFHYSMDVDLYFRFNLLSATARTVYAGEIFAEFRLHGDSKTVQEMSKKMESKFMKERAVIFYFFAAIAGDNKVNRKLEAAFPDEGHGQQVPALRMTEEKVKLLRRATDYFLLDRLTEALYVFDRKVIRRLLFRINWLHVEGQYRRKVVRMIFRHAGLFLRNRFTGRKKTAIV